MSYEEEVYEDLTPLRPEELQLIETDYTIPISDDLTTEVNYLVDSYFKIKRLEPEIEYEEQMQEYAEETIQAVLADIEIPTDDLEYLFMFVLNIEGLKNKYGNDTIFGQGNSEYSKESLYVRVEEYMQEYPELFCEPELYDMLFDIDPNLRNTPTYNRVLTYCYEDIIASGSVESLETILQLYKEGKPRAEEFVGKAEIPSESLDEFKQAFSLLTESQNPPKCIKKRFPELRKIIQEKYASDPELQQWEAQQVMADTKKKAQTYNIIKWAFLVFAILLLPVSWIFGLVLIAIWGIAYFTPFHDKISFLKEGKEAMNGTIK